MLFHLYPLNHFQLSNISENFNVIHFSTYLLDLKLLEILCREHRGVQREKFVEHYYSKELILKNIWLKKKVLDDKETLSLKKVHQSDDFLIGEAFVEKEASDRKRNKMDREIRKVINKSLDEILREGPFVALSIFRCTWNLGEDVEFYVDSSREEGPNADFEFYVVCGCRDLYEKIDHSEPLPHRNYLFRNGNPLDETQLLPQDASAQQVRQWWANLYGEKSEAMAQFDKMKPLSSLTGEILYSKQQDSQLLCAVYFRLHIWEATLSKSFEEYVRMAREDPQSIKKLNRRELQVLINILKETADHHLKEIVMKEYCLVDEMKNAFYKWENTYVEFNRRILLY